jgi:membrane protein YqaA with SNARE-associated domain
MSIEKKLESGVEKVLQTNTVVSATEVLRSKTGFGIIFAISFLESSLPLPILTDPFLMAGVLADKKNAVKLVIITTAASVMGGSFAYFGAAFFLEFILQWMTESVVDEFNSMIGSADGGVFVLTLVGAVTPIPYTIVAWVAAVVEGGLLAFIAASFIGRGFRYSVVGFCTYKFGPLAVSYAKRYIGVTSIFLLLLAGLYFWLKM